MTIRKYYSARRGIVPIQYDLATVKRLFLSVYGELCEKGYFQEAFGYYCVDQDDVPGNINDMNAFILRRLRKENMWPIADNINSYGEDDLFDMMEILYDVVARPIPTEGAYHGWNRCGWHYTQFDREAGRGDFREESNSILRDYSTGFELSPSGEVQAMADPGLQPLIEAELPPTDPTNIEQRVQQAISKFRHHNASAEERRDAVRLLADVLEYLRPKLKSIIASKDEDDLFNIANNFGIRHHNQKQKTEYDAIWLSWMFYHYLATIHVVLRRLKK